MTRQLSRRALMKGVLAGAFLTGCRALVNVALTPTVQHSLPTAAVIPPTQAPRSTPTKTPLPTLAKPIVSPSPIVAISAGGAHSLALRADGKMWAWGRGSCLGLDQEFVFAPIVLDFIENVVFIDTDDWRTSLFVDQDGQIFRTGYPDERPGLTHVAGIDMVEMARASGDTVLALRHDGTVWAYGNAGADSRGLLGLEEFEKTDKFVQLPLDHIVKLCASFRRAAFLRADGSVWIWGEGTSFGMGDNIIDPPAKYPMVSNVTDLAIGEWFSVLLSDGSLWEYRPYTIDSPRQLLQNIVQISGEASAGYNLAVDTNDYLWGWGYNNSSQFGLSREYEYLHWPFRILISHPIAAISAGVSHVLALDTEGTVWAWGSTHAGQLGIGKVMDDDFILSPTPVLRSR